MARFLAERDETARELMDDPHCDPVTLARTYARFGLVNAVVSGQRGLYRRWIRPRLAPRRTTRVLDIGTGGADLPRRLLGWARRDRLPLAVVAIDPDPRAIAFARGRGPVPGLELVQADSRAIADRGDRFDVVVSNHVLHHLDETARAALLADSERLVVQGGAAVHGDIERSPAAYAAFAALTWPFQSTLLRDTFIREDGLTSIRRSTTAAELAGMLPEGWRVRRTFPSHLEAVWTPR
ncbi:methyltransferase domain-containing protein [Microbacterium album]|uniref:Methyltransferase domain-containing protein n=1 Tax=Microbacterium album TaxID=2053191 RepID=A0A917ID80_9MICO|nr:methyltransferase domain-containing protein [Microbacterium album]GGH36530.1 hypothetical protein GCM10010921_05740 [Microbacterium album]